MRILPNSELMKALRCPLCHSDFELRRSDDDKSVSLLCRGARRHCYDLASSGYVNLMPPGRADRGDSKEAVRARQQFLSLDYYAPAADALVDLLRKYVSPNDGIAVDAGCGEGYYTAKLSSAGYVTAGADLSRFAVDGGAKRFASQGLTEGFFGVCSVYELPLSDESAAAVVNVFAPCAEAEFLRVLRPGGFLAVMYAGPEHLMGLKQALYEQTKENDGRTDLPQQMPLMEEKRVCFDIEVQGEQAVQNLFAMTPYYWKTSREDGEKLKGVSALKTKVDMVIAVYQKPMCGEENEGCKLP